MMIGLMARSLTRSAVGDEARSPQGGRLLRSLSACRLNRAHPASAAFVSRAGTGSRAHPDRCARACPLHHASHGPPPPSQQRRRRFCCLKFLTAKRGRGPPKAVEGAGPELTLSWPASVRQERVSKHRVCRMWGSWNSGSDARGPDRSAGDRYWRSPRCRPPWRFGSSIELRPRRPGRRSSVDGGPGLVVQRELEGHRERRLSIGVHHLEALAGHVLAD